jgi:hypothetical protein
MVAIASRASAQQVRALPDGLPTATKIALDRLIDSVSARGVPRGPLVDKAAEGLLKGADGDRIVRAVQSLARELGTARSALDGTNDLATLGAAASALHAGVSASDLRRLAHPSTGRADPAALTSALVTLVDLVAKRVPVETATSSIQSLLDRRASDRQFVTLRDDVERDILAGQAPEASLAARARAQIRTISP